MSRTIAYVQRRDIKRGMPASRTEGDQRDRRELVAGIVVIALLLAGFAVVGGEDLRVAVAQEGPQLTVAEAVQRERHAREQRAAFTEDGCRPLQARKAHTATQIANQCTTTERATP